MKFFNWILIFCLCHLTLFAQQNFDPGYIIQPNLDTVKGYIETVLEANYAQSIHFKKEMNAEWKVFTPADLPGFGFGNDIYKSLRFQNTAEDSIMVTAFVKQLVRGEYNLYVYQKPERKFYILQKDSTNYFLYDRVSRNSGETLQDGNYYNYLNLVSVPCENINRIVDRVSFNDKDMAAFILKVDNCESKGTATNLYQKPKTLMEPIVFVGGLPVPGYNQFTANFTLHITLPRVDKKTSINIGVNYSNTTVETLEHNDYYSKYTLTTQNQIFSVPVTFQYNFTTSLIQPYFYAGISAAYLSKKADSQNSNIPASDTRFGMALVAGIGIQAKVGSHLLIRTDWRYEVILQYPAIGIAYQF
jgi:hypothetical protein